MLSIHINLSAGAQNLKQQKLFVQGYNLKVHDVIKYMRKHRATVTNYITCKPGFCVTQ